MTEEATHPAECLLFFLLVGTNNTHMTSALQRLHRRNGFSSSSRGRILVWVSNNFILLTKAKRVMSEIFASVP